ncbi:MAG TPA: isoprenyl transferase [Clostridiaceae bacterium]|jgi:undecaprenyl diphosphate synthase|nr:isoprenyl transferase [Clostridiaceae bacterium]
MSNLENGYPEHIAIIMDGNRRWARKQNLAVKEGHKRGAETLEKIAKYCNKIGIKYLTVYAFSTENWKRSKEEVGALMLLLKNYLSDFSKRADTENIKIKVLGDISPLDKGLQKSIEKAIERTKANTGLTLNIAFNYGGRDEITRAVKAIATKVKNNEINIDDIDEQLISDNLYTKNQPDPDLLIRTSGEIRTSNFLPWQLAYTEFCFVEKYWPDFEEGDLLETIHIYQKRNRKFGGK